MYGNGVVLKLTEWEPLVRGAIILATSLTCWLLVAHIALRSLALLRVAHITLLSLVSHAMHIGSFNRIISSKNFSLQLFHLQWTIVFVYFHARELKNIYRGGLQRQISITYLSKSIIILWRNTMNNLFLTNKKICYKIIVFTKINQKFLVFLTAYTVLHNIF